MEQSTYKFLCPRLVKKFPALFWNSTVHDRIRYTYITNLLHNIFIMNYCSDMFRPQLSAVFKELAILSTFCILCVKLCGGRFYTSVAKY